MYKRQLQGVALLDVLRKQHIVLTQLWQSFLHVEQRSGSTIDAGTVTAVTARVWRLVDDAMVVLGDA
nr:MAG: hypothetical protein DIU75_16035 [Mycolicibacterium hassiacum]